MNNAKTVVLLTGLTILMLLAGQALGGRGGMTMALIFACIMNIGAYWFSDKLVLKMYRARQISSSEFPKLHQIVRELTQYQGMPMPKLYIIPQEAPNAFATGRNPEHAAVAVTEGIMNLLTKEEISGVLAHELSHVKNRDILIGTIAATIAGAITFLASMARWAMLFGGMGGDDDDEGGSPLGLVVALIMMILAPIAAMLIQMAISRSREYLADEGGAKMCRNPLYLANALQKLQRGAQAVPLHVNPEISQVTSHMFIVNPLRGKGLAALFSTHPPLEDRVKRLEKMARTGIH